jgi:hypothetical protein
VYDALDRSANRPCPGEEKCARSYDLPLFKRSRDIEEGRTTVEQVCGGDRDGRGACQRYATKAGTEPSSIAEQVGRALELDELKECGATFAYPDGLLAEEWAVLKGLRRGRQRANELAERRREEEVECKRRQQGRP